MKYVINAAKSRVNNATSSSRKLTEYERNLLVHEHRCNESGSIIQRGLPYYQYGRQSMLTESRREQLWTAISQVVKRVERKHFKRVYQEEDKHLDRVLAFYEFAEARWDKTPAWCITAFTHGFAEIEGLLQLRRLGISLSEYDKHFNDIVVFPILQYRRWFVKVLVQYFQIERRKELDPSYSYYTLYYERTGRLPSEKTVRLYELRVSVLINGINRSTENVFGFGQPRSLDDVDGCGIFFQDRAQRYSIECD